MQRNAGLALRSTRGRIRSDSITLGRFIRMQHRALTNFFAKDVIKGAPCIRACVKQVQIVYRTGCCGISLCERESLAEKWKHACLHEENKTVIEHAQNICDMAKTLVDQDLMASLSGNLSVRLDDHRVLITPTDCRKDRLSPEDLIVVDFEGNTVEGHAHMSTEGAMHLAVYQCRPDVRAVVHAHPITATACGLAISPPALNLTSEGAMFVGPVAMVDWAVPGTPALATLVAQAAQHHDAMILRHHGAVTLGATLTYAFGRMQSLEHIAKMAVIAQQLGPLRASPFGE